MEINEMNEAEMNEMVTELADKQAIRELIDIYCRAVDRLDVPLGHSIWWDDAWADYGADYYQGPGKGVIDTICADHRLMLSHSHQVANVLIALRGDSAGSEAYVHGTMRAERDGTLIHMAVWARYLDRWERRAGRWGLLQRTVVFDHGEIREVNPLPTHGPPAARDDSDPSYSVLEALG
jgi:SnoaL-like domain